VILFTVIVCALLVSLFISIGLTRYRGRWAVLDRPNARSMHVIPVPRIGGLAILFGIVTGSLVAIRGVVSAVPPVSIGLILAALVLVASVSFVDDLRGVSIAGRLLMQCAAAVLVVAGGLYIDILGIDSWSFRPGILTGGLLAIVYIVWLTNLYNFMDGLDGLAAGMGVLGFGTFALLGGLAGDSGYFLINAVIAAACLGFLFLNFPPAKIYMGDIGAASLGFLAAVLGLWANHRNLFPLWVGMAVFSPFIVDASWTLLRRLLRGALPWQAHREHVYQRLVLAGWSRRKTLLCEYGIMAVSSLLSLVVEWSKRRAVEWGALGFLILLYAVLIMGISFTKAPSGIRNAGP
jgi:UDP-N-acetylmuramyl pentapeptide phosphotransferase/UDP-N-acetylglucosamine-1-phosphate transferase